MMKKAKNFEMKRGPKLQVPLEATGSAGECGNSRKMSWTHSKDRKKTNTMTNTWSQRQTNTKMTDNEE